MPPFPDSPIMMINKPQTAEDIENFRKLPEKTIEAILRDSPGHVTDVAANVLKAFLLKMNVPAAETEKLTDKVMEKKMGELFFSATPPEARTDTRRNPSPPHRNTAPGSPSP